jgi:hypothetical protein
VFALNWPIELPDPHPFRRPAPPSAGRGHRTRRCPRPFYLQDQPVGRAPPHRAPAVRVLTTGSRRRRRRSGKRSPRHTGRRAARDRRRGVLLDVARHSGFRADEPFAIVRPPGRGSRPPRGDGRNRRRPLDPDGMDGLVHGLSAAERAVAATTPQPGLEPVERTAAWLWDHHVAAVRPTTWRWRRCPS